MQSQTYTASGSLSFWCDSVCLEVVGSRSLSCLVHQRPLPVLVSLGYYNYIISIYLKSFPIMQEGQISSKSLMSLSNQHDSSSTQYYAL